MGLSLVKDCCCYWCCCWSWACDCHNNGPASHNRVGVANVEEDKCIRLLLLGLMDSGKTEVASRLLKIKRQDYTSTNGVRCYTLDKTTDLPFSMAPCSLTEIGGNNEMQQIWHHYYIKAMGLIYCLDISASYEHMLKSIQKLEEILETPFLRGKPVLVVATKADLLLMDDSLQLYDIENAFRIEPMARKCGSRIKLCYSHLLDQNGTNATTGLLTGFKWLIQYIMVNYGNIQIRLKCDRNIQNWERALVAEPVNCRKYSKIGQNRSCLTTLTSTPTRLRHLWSRPRTAPAAIMIVRIWSTDSVTSNDSQFSTNHPYSSSVNLSTTAQVPNTPKLCNGNVLLSINS